MSKKISYEKSKEYINIYMSSYSTHNKHIISLDKWLEVQNIIKTNSHVKKIYKNLMNK
jgi:hypothetical protein